MSSAQDFPKSVRLLRRADFLRVQQSGRKVHHALFIARIVSTAGIPTRVGFTVSKKVGGAVVRNRVRRHMRECFRKQRALWPQALQVVLIARPEAAGAEAADWAQAFEDLKVRL